MAQKTVLILPNLTKNNTGQLVKSIVSQLRFSGCTPVMQEAYDGQFENVRYAPFDTLIAACDLVLTVGGDGTILHGVKHAVGHDKPVLGVNTGRLGYLAQVEADEIRILSRLAADDYAIQQRMLLEIRVGEDGEPLYALNDVVISKGDLARMVDLDISGDGQAIGSYRADGVILATPTGSTAYSLSAGGPIVDPSIDTIIVTPICPHSLNDRAVLLSPRMRLRVQSRYINASDKIVVSVDGENVALLGQNTPILIRMAEKTARFISFPEKTFTMILREKLKPRG